jgi:hypothetical protein
LLTSSVLDLRAKSCTTSKMGTFGRQVNRYFQKNKDALGLIFYSDELEVCNPLGAAKGRQKVLNLYLSIAEISKPLRYLLFSKMFCVTLIFKQL